jgi:UDP-glucose 4-epimerase
MKILITGGFGYLGLLLGKSLSSLGHQVTLYGKRHDDIALTVRLVEGDIFDTAQLAAACKGTDAVLHLAAVSAPVAQQDEALARRVNVEGTETVLAAAQEAGIRRFIYFSTVHVYGNLVGTISESTVPAPISAYGRTKLAGEEVCRRQKGVDITIVRLSNVYGAPLGSTGWDLVVNDLCKQAVETGSIHLRSPHIMRNFVAAGDVSQALEIVLGRTGDGETYLVPGAITLNILDLSQRIARVAKALNHREIRIVMPEDVPQSSPLFTLRGDKLKKLGYAPTQDMDHVLMETMEAAVARWKN